MAWPVIVDDNDNCADLLNQSATPDTNLNMLTYDVSVYSGNEVNEEEEEEVNDQQENHQSSKAKARKVTEASERK